MSQHPLANSLTPHGSETIAANRRKLILSRLSTVILAIYWLALFYGTHTKVPEGMLPGNSDKLIHFWAYAGLGMLLLAARAAHGSYRWPTVAIFWIILATYGIFDELTQLLVNRNADVNDWLCDITGAATGLLVATLLISFLRTHLQLRF